MSARAISQLLEDELALVSDARVVRHIRQHLVEPEVVMRPWDYGLSPVSYPCWAVFSPPHIGIAYSEFGFGPELPWGLVNVDLSPEPTSMGMDSGWFSSFMEAYFDCAASELSIWMVFKHENEPFPGRAITEEADWDSTWRRVKELRASDLTAKYYCHHGVRYGRRRMDAAPR